MQLLIYCKYIYIFLIVIQKRGCVCPHNKW